jgi:hypothetical protein
VLTHFVVSDHVVRSWRFYTGVPGGKTAMEGEPPVAALANNWIIINTRGGLPTTSQASPSRPRQSRQDQPAAHPMALINPAATAITYKLPSACLAIPEASGKPGWPLVLHRGRTPVTHWRRSTGT